MPEGSASDLVPHLRPGWHAVPMTDDGAAGWELWLDGERRAVCIAPGRLAAEAIMDAVAGEVHYDYLDDPTAGGELA